jgi:hypothetical protein
MVTVAPANRSTTASRSAARWCVPLLLGVALLSAGGAVQAQEPVEPAATLHDGLLFARGEFVPGPYALAQAEGPDAVEVRLAGITLDRIPVRDPAKSAEVEAADPGPYVAPVGVSGLRGSGYPLYLQKLMRHHVENLGAEQALDRVAKQAESSPLVHRVERRPDGLLIFDRSGDPYFVSAGPFLEPAGLTRAEARALAEQTLRAYRGLLEQGGAILHFEDSDVFLPRARVEDVLIPTLRLFEDSSVPAAGKSRQVAVRWGNREIADKLLNGYRSSPELDKALLRYLQPEEVRP